MKKHTFLTPADRILAYLEREDQIDEKVPPMDPEAEAVFNMSPDDLEIEALSIDPQHIAHLEHLKAMVGLAAKGPEADTAAQTMNNIDEKDAGTDAANCNLPDLEEHLLTAKVRLGSLIGPYHQHYAGKTAHGRSIARGRFHFARSARREKIRSSISWSVFHSASVIIVVAMLTGSFTMDYQQIQNADVNNRAIHNRLAELSSRVNVLTSALKAPDNSSQQKKILSPETEKREYTMALMNWMFDQSANAIRPITSLDCSSYCKKGGWDMAREEAFYRSINYIPSSNTEKIYASK